MFCERRAHPAERKRDESTSDARQKLHRESKHPREADHTESRGYHRGGDGEYRRRVRSTDSFHEFASAITITSASTPTPSGTAMPGMTRNSEADFHPNFRTSVETPQRA